MTDSPAEELRLGTRQDMTGTGTAAAAELARLGETYFATKHSYDPFNAVDR